MEIIYGDMISAKERLFRPMPKYRDLIRGILGVALAVLALVYIVSLIQSQVLVSQQYRNFVKYGNTEGFIPVK